MKSFLVISLAVIGISVACAGSKSASSPSVATGASPITLNSPANPAAPNQSACLLSRSQAPAIHGLKLGMTADEVLAVFPGSKDDPELRAHLSEPPSRFGVSGFLVKPSKYDTGEKFKELTQVTLTLLDGRVSGLSVGFNGPEWPHVDKFVAKFVDGSTLPIVDQWQAYPGMDNQMKTLTCADFEIRVFAGGEGGKLNYVAMKDLEADKQLKDRRAKAKAAASPSPEQ